MSNTPVDREGNRYDDYILFSDDSEHGYCAKNIVSGKYMKGTHSQGYRKIIFMRRDVDNNKIQHVSSLASWRACTFIGPPPTDHHTADHIDRNRRNDSLTNIRWATKTEQVLNKDKVRNSGKHVPIIATRGDDVRHYRSLSIACEELNLRRSNASGVLFGKYTHIKGWVFRYDYIQDFNGEVWINYNPKYYVSNHGRIKKEVPGGYVEITHDTKKDYITIRVGSTNRLLHVVIAELFGDLIARRQLDPNVQVDHINGDRKNNHINNLQVLNSKDHVTKTLGKPVLIEDRGTNICIEFPSITEAANHIGENYYYMSNYLSNKSEHPKYNISYVVDAKRMKFDTT
jgi:hypothetical protein